MFAFQILLLAVSVAVCSDASRVIPTTFGRRVGSIAPELQKRADEDFNITLTNLGNVEYLVNISVGTPSQNVQVSVNMAGDLWIPGPVACIASNTTCAGGSYDVTQSSTGKNATGNGNYSISYVDGSGYSGFYVIDVVSIGSVSLPSLTFAEVTSMSPASIGIMGIGYDTDEGGVSNGVAKYPNMLDTMVIQGLINRRVYSLLWNGHADGAGTILFGGYDNQKFENSLTPVPLLADSSGHLSNFQVSLSSVYLTESSGTNLLNSSYPLTVGLELGVTLSFLPNELYSRLIAPFNVTSYSDGLVLVDCGGQDLDVAAEFEINYDLLVQIPASQLVVPYLADDGTQIVQNGVPLCFFAANNATDNYILGDTFLRSIYAVFDLDADICYMAQAYYNSTSSNVQEIAASGLGNVSTITGVSVAQPTLTVYQTTSETSTIFETSTVSMTSSPSVFAQSSAVPQPASFLTSSSMPTTSSTSLKPISTSTSSGTIQYFGATSYTSAIPTPTPSSAGMNLLSSGQNGAGAAIIMAWLFMLP